MPLDEQWVQDWFNRLDRGARYEAITDLRLNAEKNVLALNREIGERLKEFSKAILELCSYLEAGEAAEKLDERYDKAMILEHELRDLEQTLDLAKKDYDAFEHMERKVNSMPR